MAGQQLCAPETGRFIKRFGKFEPLRFLSEKSDISRPGTAAHELFSGTLQGVVIESTYNWYWLVDGLMAEGFAVHLANPSAIQKYKGLKHADDKHDAFWLAEMLRLNILPEGYIARRRNGQFGIF